MRNFSSRIPHDQVVYVLTDTAISDMKAYRLLLCRALEIHPSQGENLSTLTPSEERVLKNFAEWIVSIDGSDPIRSKPTNAAFCYVNLNTGVPLVFVAWYGWEDYAGNHSVGASWSSSVVQLSEGQEGPLEEGAL